LVSGLAVALGACGNGGTGPGEGSGDEPLLETPGPDNRTPGGGGTEIATGGDSGNDANGSGGNDSSANEEERKDDHGKGDEQEKNACLPPTKVAIEGERVPDTR
jgi:hypothetical protein